MRRGLASLQLRLLALVMALVCGVWAVVGVATWLDVQHELDELLDAHLAQAAALLVVQQAREMDDDDDGKVSAPSLHRYAPKVAFQVFHEGKLQLRSDNAPTTPLSGGLGGFTRGFQSVALDDQRWRVFAARGADADVQVYVGELESSRTDILMAVLRSTFWPMLLALPLLALGVWVAVYRGMAPLRRMGQQLAERNPGALNPVVLDNAPSEMRPMVEALNGLFARITGLMASERRFTADAAHELRTPIAAIRAQAQVALGEANDAQRQHALRATLEGCDRAVRLVEQLLTLSRLESGAGPAMVPVDLGALVWRVVADLAPQALAKAQRIEMDEAPKPCTVNGDATLLGVLVRNLVDNAIRYSPPGATVLVGWTQLEGQLALTVQDSGPGLSDADLKHLGERFFRVLGTGQGGSGLGWSIVRRIAIAHGAQVSVGRSEQLGGLRVQVLSFR
jgi:two-component system, OmpR family, sensor histidine kinase QseC